MHRQRLKKSQQPKKTDVSRNDSIKKNVSIIIVSERILSSKLLLRSSELSNARSSLKIRLTFFGELTTFFNFFRFKFLLFLNSCYNCSFISLSNKPGWPTACGKDVIFYDGKWFLVNYIWSLIGIDIGIWRGG